MACSKYQKEAVPNEKVDIFWKPGFRLRQWIAKVHARFRLFSSLNWEYIYMHIYVFCLFIYNLIHLQFIYNVFMNLKAELQRKWEREKSFIWEFTLPMAGQVWFSLKPGTRTIFWVSHMGISGKRWNMTLWPYWHPHGMRVSHVKA